VRERERSFFLFFWLFISLSQSWHTLSHAPKVETTQLSFSTITTHIAAGIHTTTRTTQKKKTHTKREREREREREKKILYIEERERKRKRKSSSIH
jgi:hypothetical protein